jgi:TetR/AcrR family transcriptional regulator of autoinduction and epiphytic fitness
VALKALNQEADERREATSGNLRLEEERVAELLDVATEVFIEHGFEGASTNEIARRANCSKATFYSRFPTKQDLFIAVLERRTEEVFKEVFAALPIEVPVEEALMEFSARVLRIALSDAQIRLKRVVSMEAERFPKLAQRFYELGPKRSLEELSRYFHEQIERGRFIKEDPLQMAEHFSSLITSGPIRWKDLGIPCTFGSKGSKRRLQAAVKVFLRAYSRKRR